MSYGTDDGDIYWHGYGIESIKTFLNDIVSLNNGTNTLSDLEGNRPSFRESLISTMVTEASHKSLESGSRWEAIEVMK